ncbi:hypothetical protein GN956_G16438 [Arapaima gigas]
MRRLPLFLAHLSRHQGTSAPPGQVLYSTLHFEGFASQATLEPRCVELKDVVRRRRPSRGGEPQPAEQVETVRHGQSIKLTGHECLEEQGTVRDSTVDSRGDRHSCYL